MIQDLGQEGNNVKYICTEDEEGKQEIFPFSRTIDHDCMARQIEQIRTSMFGNFDYIIRRPISAGFIKGRKCYGRSETLNLDSRPEDSDLLRKELYA